MSWSRPTLLSRTPINEMIPRTFCSLMRVSRRLSVNIERNFPTRAFPSLRGSLFLCTSHEQPFDSSTSRYVYCSTPGQLFVTALPRPPYWLFLYFVANSYGTNIYTHLVRAPAVEETTSLRQAGSCNPPPVHQTCLSSKPSVKSTLRYYLLRPPLPYECGLHYFHRVIDANRKNY